MTQEPVSATLFAYQVGFGDCLLLRFGYADGSMRHMLFDFGTTSLPEGAAKDHMLQVATDIAAKCREGGGDRLDVLVATHRHADHISGFATREGGTGSGDVIARLRPRVVVQPWTEAPEAPVDWKGPKGENGAKAFATHRAGLQAMHDTAAAALAFVDRAGGRMPAAVREQIAFIGEDNLSNLSAVKNLQVMGDRHEYVFHGCVLDLSDEVPGVVVDVLGPPTLEQTDSIRKQRSKDRDEFWQLTAKRMGKLADRTASPSLFPDAPFRPANRMLAEYRWLLHRLDHASADLTLSLVRALDDQMNNTSVIMVMRVGGRTLLFPGDAQIENWAYALQSPLAELLDDVDLYKVGHHGSLNATPKSMWARFRKRSGGKEADKLTSVVSTKAGKHGSEEKSTEVPRRTLIAELEKESHLHSTQRLRADVLYDRIDIPLGGTAASSF